MIPLFDRRYFEKRRHLASRAPLVCQALCRSLRPTSLIDVGCSIGDLVRGFLDLGVDAYGCDRHIFRDMLLFPVSRYINADVCGEVMMPKWFDVAMCVEVLGVVPERSFSRIASNLSCMADRLVVCADPVIRAPFDRLLGVLGFDRMEEKEREIREELDEYKRKMSIKAFWYGLSVWRRQR